MCIKCQFFWFFFFFLDKFKHLNNSDNINRNEKNGSRHHQICILGAILPHANDCKYRMKDRMTFDKMNGVHDRKTYGFDKKKRGQMSAMLSGQHPSPSL